MLSKKEIEDIKKKNEVKKKSVKEGKLIKK